MNAEIQKPNRLERVIKGKLEKPIRLVFYATDGLGKSTFASKSPSPIFIGAEDGTAQLDVARMPDIESWRDILSALVELTQVEHDYKTVVLDTADWAEPMNWAHVCKARKWEDLETPGYGKGPAAALDEWRVLLSHLERVRARGMNVIVLAHSVIKTFKNPQEIGDFDRYEMALNPKASGLLRQWADCVLFGEYETLSVTDKNKRTRGISTGARIIHTERRAAFDAKNRYGLPETMPLDWDTFADAVAAGGSPDALTRSIEALLVTAEATFAAKVRAAVATNPTDAAFLARVLNKLKATLTQQGSES